MKLNRNMKKVFVFYILVSLFFTACTKTNINEDFIDDTVVQLQFSPVYEIIEITKAATSISSLATRLDVWIIDGTETQAVHQSSTDAGFGTISVTLNKTKTYTLYAIAHSANGQASLEDNVVSFPDNKVTQTLFYTTTFCPATTTSLSAVMTRISAQFRMETADAIPNDVTQMKFTVYNTGTTFNVSTGTFGNKIDKVTHYTSISRANDGTASFTVSLFPDNITETANFRITVDAMKANDDVYKQREFLDVPIKSNYKTVYHGTFFTDQSFSSSFLVDDWLSFDTVNF